jgi:LysR family transcriptional regulator, transcriptional activator of the cysJI operon
MLDTKILTFITVARTKNFTRTSEILNVTQPAVSQHIKALEEYYDVKLFYKKGKEMGLTEEGKLLYQYAIDMHRLDKNIKVQLKNKTSVIKKYNVGATLTIGGYVLPKIIGEYRKSYENTDIVLFVENTEIIMKQLNSGDIDIGVVEGPFDKTKVRYKKFKDDELVLVVSPNHRFAEKESVTVKEVLMSKLILRERGSGTRKVLEDKLLQEGYTIEDMNVYMEIGNITAIVSLVELGLGCTIISKEAVKMSVLNNKLRIVPIKDFKIIREFNFVYIDDMNMDFIDHFTKFCLKH